ncbi:efflux RND transporter periplasmic adaptor subunit [Inquilinus sp. Marseille-Q2685]|uniref:efflux RND transporter periplasmic adaptor subunit n=1 Tax=Inquilinus sp. Marseille-Q2685 TaxID=2866581 RepID=UPI001CE4AEF7|nr:efflux RND transporter periplasmic adaptor subunit [Inquilinus sp. Marseille-Q2685]
MRPIPPPTAPAPVVGFPLMNKKHLLLSLALSLLAIGAAGVLVVSGSAEGRRAQDDPRSAPPVVAIAEARTVGHVERAFTGSISARVQSNLGFRVPGKIVERLVDVGERVAAGQPLMRIDENDLRLALTARQNAVAAARAVAVQARADDRRYADLVAKGWATKQRHEQARAALDSAEAQLAAAEAEARVAANEAEYSTLEADADGIVVETLGEPGQVVAAGQVVVRLAHAGPREATVALPETVRLAMGSRAEASVYGVDQRRWPARLRQLSDSADPQTRTYEARYVLDGDAASAPLGATVTLWIADADAADAVEVPIGAVLDDGGKPGVWVIDQATSTVGFRPVTIRRLGGETAIVSGLEPGERIAALGAHLLHEGETVRTLVAKADTP